MSTTHEGFETPPTRQHQGTLIDRAVASKAERAVDAFRRWLDEFGELSQDPHDFWASPLGGRAKRLYYHRPVLGHLAAAPFVALDTFAPRARRFVRPPARQPIADAHYALAFFDLARSTGEPQHVERGRGFLTKLDESRTQSSADPAWGYAFDWPSRYRTFPAGTPLITTLPYCYEAFEAGFDSTGDSAYLRTMEGIARFAATGISVTAVAEGVEAAAYSPLDRTLVVNASAYRGLLLSIAGTRLEREDWVEAGHRNIAFVLQSQNDNGSWPYSMDEGDTFVDNFHTCFVLKNLAKTSSAIGDEAIMDAVRLGYDFYLEHLLDHDGLPIPFAEAPRFTLHRRDLYDYAEGINLASLLRDEIPAAHGVLERLVDDLVERWQLPDGHFATCERAVGRNTVPYHRWAQAQTFHSLAHLAAPRS